jgi:hypothetical protein
MNNQSNNMSKIALASEEPNLFELFRAPKIFEAKPQRVPLRDEIFPFGTTKLRCFFQTIWG